MAEEVKHYQINGKYRIVFERASVKGIDGFKVEANGDDSMFVQQDAKLLYEYAQKVTKPEVM